MDAKKGESVALAQIDRYLKICESIENEECLTAEAYLKDVRKKGAEELALIAKNSKIVRPTFVEEHHAWDILSNSRRQKLFTDSQTAIEISRENLYAINETLHNGSAILDERICKIRKKTLSKLKAYTKGLRAGGLSFNSEVNFSDIASELYYSKHLKLDDAIDSASKVPVFDEVIE